MKLFCFSLLFFVSVITQGICQNENFKIEKGISFISDIAWNLHGGIKNGRVGITQLKTSMNLTYRSKRDLGNGNFYFDFMINRGTPFSALSGDIQVISNLESPDMTSFFEIWYKHSFREHTVMAGLIDINAHFLFTDYSLPLINSSFGIQPTLSVNIPLSIFPLTSLGAIYKVNLSEKTQLSAGVFDGVPQIRNDNSLIPDLRLDRREGFFSVLEGRINFNMLGKPANFKAGTWWHSGQFELHDSDHFQNNFGTYVILDRLQSGNLSRGLFVWLKAGTAPFNCNVIKHFLGAGLSYKDPFGKCEEDYISAGFASADLCNHYESPDTGNAMETAIEITLKKNFGRLFLQPDLQYILNPSGRMTIQDCLCGLIRAGITFQD